MLSITGDTGVNDDQIVEVSRDIDQCLGIHLATMQAKAFLYQLLRRFELELDTKRPTKFQMVPMPHPTNDLPVRLRPIR